MPLIDPEAVLKYIKALEEHPDVQLFQQPETIQPRHSHDYFRLYLQAKDNEPHRCI